jgi:drug/metabolite transporter (DMT)-like permease
MQGLIGTCWTVAAALFYGTMNISAKLGATHLSVWQTAMGRFALGLALVPILARLFRFDLFGRERWFLLASGIAGTLGFVLIIQAYRSIPLSMAMVLFYLWPMFSCLLSPWIDGEPTGKREWPFVVGALLGTILILWPDRAGAGLNEGHFMALAASFFSGLAVILARRLRRVNNPFTIYFFYCMIGGVISLGPLLTQAQPVVPVSGTGWMLLSAVALFAMGGQVLLNHGLKYLPASKTGALMMIEVIVAGAFGALFLGETLTLRFFLGGVLILGCGTALTALPASREDAASQMPS